jgi:hypothetical protein
MKLEKWSVIMSDDITYEEAEAVRAFALMSPEELLLDDGEILEQASAIAMYTVDDLPATATPAQSRAILSNDISVMTMAIAILEMTIDSHKPGLSLVH